MVAEDEVLAVERDEGIGEHEDDDERDAEQNDDEEKVWLLRGLLLNFHGLLDAQVLMNVGGWVVAVSFLAWRLR